MEILTPPGHNHVFGAPGDMQDGSCAALPVILYRDEYGVWAQSLWKPTAEELAALNQGQGIALSIRISGEPDVPAGHPVVSLGVTTGEVEGV